MEKRALGRGLSALIPETIRESETQGEVVLQVPVSQIKTNKYQPRLAFDQEKLNDLVNSIKEKGVIQPVLVRRVPDGYELIAGERRLRAAKTLGLEKMPAIVKSVADVDMLEISLIENIQREELNAIEEASAFQKFITDFHFTQERIAKAVGKDRTTVANTMRLLGLPKKIQDFVSAGKISAGHAKALGLEKMPAIVKSVADVDMLEISLIENIQREELNAMEAASAFQKFITDFHFTQERIAQAVGKDRTTIANSIRLLGLPEKVQDFVSAGKISAGHAKALLALPTEEEQLRVSNLIVKKGLSVREAERLVARRAAGGRIVAIKKDQSLVDIEGQLQQLFGTRVRIFHGKKRGRIQIEYYSHEDPNRILDLLGKK